MSNLPKIYNPLPEKTDFSDSITSLNELKNLSDIGNAIVTKMEESARFAHENANNNAVLLEEKKRHNLLIGYIEEIANAEEKELLLKEFVKLRKSYEKNTSWLSKVGSDVKVSLLDKGDEKLSAFGSKVMGIKDNMVSSLPPFWKGLYDIGMDAYQKRVENKREVNESLESILNDNSSTEEIANEGNNTQTSTNNQTTNNEISDNSFDGLEELIHKLVVDKESGLIDTNAFNEIIEGINEENLLLNEISIFAKHANEEEMKLLQELLNTPEKFSARIREEFEKISNVSIEDGKVFTDVTYDIQNERHRNYIEESKSSTSEVESVSKEEISQLFSDVTNNLQKDISSFNQEEVSRSFSNISEGESGFDSASAISQEKEDDYRRDSLEEQIKLNDSVEKIYKFISGNTLSKNVKSSKNGEGSSGGVLSFLGSLAGDFVGGKVGKLLKPIANSKIGTKVLSSKVGQKFMTDTNIGKALSGMGLGNTAENVGMKTAKESVEKISKESTEALTKKATTEVTESIAKEGAEKVATKAAGKTAAKTGMKAVGKSLLKKIPGVSLIAGLGFGLNKLLSGDGIGAMMEVASGLAGTIPVLGTIASTAIDAASAARDISKETEEIIPQEEMKSGTFSGGKVDDYTFEPQMKNVSIGGEGGDDFRFDDLPPTPKVEVKPFKQSILPDTNTITDMDFDYSKFNPDDIITSDSGKEAFAEVPKPLPAPTPIVSRTTDYTNVRMRDGTFGGGGADDFRFDDLPPASKVEVKPFKESILPDVDSITDMGFDYSEFDQADYPMFNRVEATPQPSTSIIPKSEGLMDGSTKTPTATSQSGGENFTPVNAPKNPIHINPKLNEMFNSHITTKDDGKVIERHVDGVEDLKNDIKKYYKSRDLGIKATSRLIRKNSPAEVYNQALLEEVYGKNYSVSIQPQGIYDRNNDMAFTPIVKDDNGIITKILKNPSDHIKKDEEGYVPPNSFMSMSDELSTQYQSDYNKELSTRSMEEQTDRKRLSDLQEASFWSGGMDNPEGDKEIAMLQEKIAKNYAPLQTEVNSNQYTVGAKMSELIDNRVNQTSNIQSVNKPSTSSSTVLQEHPTTSKQGRDAAYTTSSTRSGAPTKTKESQQPPVIVNNNYNTTNNNVPSSSSNKQTPPPQMIVNPMPASVWGGGGWGGMR